MGKCGLKTAKESTNEGLAELAGVAERDHEVQMARADLYKIATKYAIKLHEMLKGVLETEGMQGWQQSKITKAADYMGQCIMQWITKINLKVLTKQKKKCVPATLR